MTEASYITTTASEKALCGGSEAIQPCSTLCTPFSEAKTASVHQWQPPPKPIFLYRLTSFQLCLLKAMQDTYLYFVLYLSSNDYNMTTTAIITGASGGIGAAIAFALACQQNISVILLARNEEKLRMVADQIVAAGGACRYHLCDVTKQSDIENVFLVERASLSLSKLILVNNAGYGGPFQRTDEITEAEWDAVFNTNSKAAFRFCKRLLPLMKENNWGRVINIASVYGSMGGALSSAYVASKHALIGYTKSLASEWGEYGITCNIISPGFTDTAMGASANEKAYHYIVQQIPAKRQGTPEEVAKLVLFLCSENSGYINGADIIIDGGLTAGKSF